ncbi:Alpha/Beta hydrolase protein [Mycotypha africana]|uniref:Alpha/Beta hydrolase protein n=1 Tax=Mycotypha africana TaxID=64632 RepID=UPI00230191C9|nr:Alpha/Beta hydrolase protein [Mycotypha africana]KAI8967459.1 Alpha/Beta hydrolase protein [Mycotypha africana]
MLDKYDPSTYNHRYAQVNGIRMHYVDENSTSKNALLLCHGWPDLWLGWREQIPFLVQLGYRVIAPSLRGFGETDAPENPSEYGFGTVSKDLAELLDHLEIPTVTVIGHDWGGLVVWRFAQFYPERVNAIASFCTPYMPPHKQEISLEQIVQAVPNFSYQLYLVTPEAEKDINDNVGKFFRRIFRPVNDMVGDPFIDPDTKRLAEGRRDCKSLVPAKVLDYYIEWYTKRGARGGLNWYKQTHNNFHQCKNLDPVIKKKSLMVTAEKDFALPPSMAEGMSKLIPDLQLKSISGSGHWVLWEKPEECNNYLEKFLAGVEPTINNKL